MIIVLWAWALAAFAQLEPREPSKFGDKLIGTWHSYQTFRQGSHVAFRGATAYMLTNSGLLIYDAESGEERRFGRVHGFPSGKTTGLFYDKAADFVFVTFEDGLVVYFREPEEMYFIRDVVVSENVINKAVYYAEGNGRFVYLSADFGLMAYDLSRRETRFSYFKIGDSPAFTPVLRHGFYQGRIYALTRLGDLYSADLSHPNLADGAAWRKDTSGVKNFCAAPNGVYIHAEASVGRFDGTEWTTVDSFANPRQRFRCFKPMPDGRIVYIPVESNNTVFVVGDTDLKTTKTVYDVYDFAADAQGRFSASADGYLGLTVFDKFMGYNRHESHLNVFHPENNEPPSNAAHRLAVGPGEIYIAPGSPYTDDGFYRVDLESGEWKLFPRDTVRSVDMKNYYQAFYVDGKAYMSAYELGVKEVERGEVQRTWVRNEGCLAPLGSLNPRVMGAAKDKQGNLWMILSDNNLPLLKISPNGTCNLYELPGLSNQSGIFAFALDDADNKWVVSRNQILVFNSPDSLNSPTGLRRLQQVEGRGGLPGGSKLNCLALDKDGHMWVGSSNGISVYYVAAAALRSTYDATCPVFNFRCLLEAETVNDIYVDGANRKWMATENSGVYVFDATGTRQIAQFTVNNSPLPSNRVTDIEAEPRTGEIFFATEGGLVSFKGNATEGVESNDELFVYPNPVRGDYDGPINVYPSVAGSVVKIVTPTGRLVRELESEGGRTVWDGRDLAGMKVQPGVYVVLVSTDDGKNKGMAKFAVLGN